MQVEAGSPRVQERASGVEEKRPLVDRAGKETDGSNLRRRQVQGKVFTRRGQPCTCCQLRERSQGRRWEAQERGETMKEGSGQETPNGLQMHKAHPRTGGDTPLPVRRRGP